MYAIEGEKVLYKPRSGLGVLCMGRRRGDGKAPHFILYQRALDVPTYA